MIFTRRSSFLALAGALALAAPLVTPAAAQTKLKFVLNWKYQGP
jgi:NitT/TauT family transport system substrate-binding protein